MSLISKDVTFASDVIPYGSCILSSFFSPSSSKQMKRLIYRSLTPTNPKALKYFRLVPPSENAFVVQSGCVVVQCIISHLTTLLRKWEITIKFMSFLIHHSTPPPSSMDL